MAKLGKRQALTISFLLNKMALTYGQEKRNELLARLLDELGIDADQRAEGEAMARYSVQKDLRAPAPAITFADIVTVNPDGTVDSDADKFNAASSAVRQQVLDYLDKLCAGEPAQLPKAPSAPNASQNDDAPRYNTTAKQQRHLARFDAMTDGEQVDQLKGLWGDDESTATVD